MIKTIILILSLIVMNQTTNAQANLHCKCNKPLYGCKSSTGPCIYDCWFVCNGISGQEYYTKLISKNTYPQLTNHVTESSSIWQIENNSEKFTQIKSESLLSPYEKSAGNQFSIRPPTYTIQFVEGKYSEIKKISVIK